MTNQQCYYKALRNYWHVPAAQAWSMAHDRVNAEEAGITFHWTLEQESPLDVFGPPDKKYGPFYDPEDEFYFCAAKHGDAALDLLGMIDGAHDKLGFAGYWFLVECEMAGEALAALDALIHCPDFDVEETLA